MEHMAPVLVRAIGSHAMNVSLGPPGVPTALLTETVSCFDTQLDVGDANAAVSDDSTSNDAKKLEAINITSTPRDSLFTVGSFADRGCSKVLLP